MVAENVEDVVKRTASTPLTDLGLTLPIFVLYHLGVVLLPVRNAADWMTRELINLADHDLAAYAGLTLSIAAVYVGILVVLGRRQSLHWDRFAWLLIESLIYAFAMRLVASYVVGRVLMVPGVAEPFLTGAVMSLGAGFYEEVAFRVILFGLGLKALFSFLLVTTAGRKFVWSVVWAIACACAFSAWHYFGELGESFELTSFVFRAVCGLVFTLIYTFRGFAPAVWTHTLYDLWVLLF